MCNAIELPNATAHELSIMNISGKLQEFMTMYCQRTGVNLDGYSWSIAGNGQMWRSRKKLTAKQEQDSLAYAKRVLKYGWKNA